MADNTFLVKLGMNTQELVNGANKATSVLSNLQNTVRAIGIGFSAIQIGNFVKDVSKLAGEAEGVTAAFNRLEGSAKLMVDLKEATGGTVSELELMKRSVMASNFDISLKALPQLLEFATLRARQTGQSVDYLVDSIVTGIGRKSKLILDNLGISAVQLTEALGGASAASSTIGEVAEAVGKIATENLEKMGKLTDDAAVRADRLKANWDNLKVSLGQLANNAGVSWLLEKTGQLVEGLNQGITGRSRTALKDLEINLDLINEMIKQGDYQKFDDAMQNAQNLARQAGVEILKLSDAIGNVNYVVKDNRNYIWKNGDDVKAEVRNVKFLEDQIKSLNEEISLSGSRSQISKYQNEIKELQKEIDKLLGKEEKLDDLYKQRFEWQMGNLQFKKTPDMADWSHFRTDKFKPTTPASDSMADASKILAERVDNDKKKLQKAAEEMKQSITEVGQRYMQVGDEIGQGFGMAISGTMTFAQAMERMAASVVDSIERIVLARMIEKSFEEGGPTPVAIALAAAGFGMVKALFNRIGRHSQISSSGGSSMPMSSYSGNRQLVAQVSGRQLNFVLTENQRYDSRTNTTG